ncbi:hypothetical protein HMPREF9996_00931 [Aggregatibacter actinomycetemcomitans Y4]|nr:hypothetical protein HMPREF9996_00931 [Aggregatibacter actinomycetemcomitans Y4]
MIPGDKVPSAFSTGAGVLEEQAANTAMLIGNSKKELFICRIP